ncbi:MAG TPA: hypothetical protein VKQ30_05610 [Ktedonobacterales bacterium]|jgi:hypothetical protein|nr:hypothetical protein [Ktedonobacterales bacterium]
MSQRISSTDRAAYLSLSILGVVGTILIALIACLATNGLPVARSHQSAHSTIPAALRLSIVAQKPGSSVQGPAYMPTTDLALPAHSLVTITIVNQDAGDTSLTPNSPFAKVTGTSGGMAYLDGQPYRALDASKVAHTFTIPQLGVNVPIPGDIPQGQKTITVTFSFMTGNAGTYMWRCMDPCGSNSDGWGGPMVMPGYMQGTLAVE